MPDDKTRHVLFHMSPETIRRQREEFPKRATEALTNVDCESVWESFYALDGGFVFDSLANLLAHSPEPKSRDPNKS